MNLNRKLLKNLYFYYTYLYFYILLKIIYPITNQI